MIAVFDARYHNLKRRRWVEAMIVVVLLLAISAAAYFGFSSLS